jgi:hypothetical protein
MDSSIADAFILVRRRNSFWAATTQILKKDRMKNVFGQEIGVEISLNGGDSSDIPQAIGQAYRDGRLWIIRGESIVPSNTPLQDN